VAILTNASVVVDTDGKIYAVGLEKELETMDWYQTAQFDADVDMTGRCLIPGLVDAHTHPVCYRDTIM
jgi:imidazolonepropionase